MCVNNLQWLPITLFLSETCADLCSELTCWSPERILLVVVVVKASEYDCCTVRVVFVVKASATSIVTSPEQSCSVLPHVYSGVFYDLLIGSIL
jgi:hypothetical protein